MSFVKSLPLIYNLFVSTQDHEKTDKVAKNQMGFLFFEWKWKEPVLNKRQALSVKKIKKGEKRYEKEH